MVEEVEEEGEGSGGLKSSWMEHDAPKPRLPKSLFCRKKERKREGAVSGDVDQEMEYDIIREAEQCLRFGVLFKH